MVVHYNPSRAMPRDVNSFDEHAGEIIELYHNACLDDEHDPCLIYYPGDLEPGTRLSPIFVAEARLSKDGDVWELLSTDGGLIAWVTNLGEVYLCQPHDEADREFLRAWDLYRRECWASGMNARTPDPFLCLRTERGWILECYEGRMGHVAHGGAVRIANPPRSSSFENGNTDYPRTEPRRIHLNCSTAHLGAAKALAAYVGRKDTAEADRRIRALLSSPRDRQLATGVTASHTPGTCPGVFSCAASALKTLFKLNPTKTSAVQKKVTSVLSPN